MNWIKRWTQETSSKKLLALLSLALLIFLIRDMLNVIILTFIIGFILANIRDGIYKVLSRWVDVPKKLILILVYIVTLTSLGFLLSSYIPIIMYQLGEIVQLIGNFNYADLVSTLNPSFSSFLLDIDFSSYIEQLSTIILSYSKLLWSVGFQIIMAFLLSFLFLWEQPDIVKFMKRFEKSKIATFYEYYVELGRKFINSFGKMIQLQIVISTINTSLSAVMLIILGFQQVIGLSFMIFILGLIPVAGVVISLVPLSLIAFQIGGLSKVIAVLVMIALIHALESYVLNPKLTSKKMHLPVFFTFFILLFGEHYLGIWGLLIGLPLVIFVLDLLDANPPIDNKAENL